MLFVTGIFVLGSFMATGLAYFISKNTGDSRYDEDGIGKIVRLFQIITFTAKPATKCPRPNYVEILKQFIANFNKDDSPIVGDTHFIKATVYQRMTGCDDYELFDRMSSTMIKIANNETSAVEVVKVIYWIARSGVYDYNQLIMKISLSATLCTLLALPETVENQSILDKAVHYRLIRFKGSNPFVGITACPMFGLWQTIKVPKITNTDSAQTMLIKGDVIRYVETIATDAPPSGTGISAMLGFVQANAFVAILPFFLRESISPHLLINSLAYTLGFEVWNQFNSEAEDEANGKQRPKALNKSLLLTLWAATLIVAEWPVRVWLSLCPVVYYLLGNSSPIKESLMFVGIYVHLYYLELPLDPMMIARHAIMGCIQDLRDVKGDRAIGRFTLPMLFEGYFSMAYALVGFAFWYADSTMTTSVMMLYVLVALCGHYDPPLSYKVWQLGYVAELLYRCHN